MYRRFIAPEIDRPFTIFVREHKTPLISRKFCEIKFSGMFADCFGGERNFNDEHYELNDVVKITYTYYDWMKKRKINQIIYKK
jgi:hypothetical protein